MKMSHLENYRNEQAHAEAIFATSSNTLTAPKQSVGNFKI